MSDLMLDVGTASDLKMAFRRAGFDTADITKLCKGDMAAKILPILRGLGIVQIVKHIIDLASDCMPKDWKSSGLTIEKHVGDGTLELDPSWLQLHFSPNQIDGKTIEGYKLRKELETSKVHVLNACVLDYLLTHPEIIPEDWKVDENGNTRYIFFWGTLYRSPDGRLYVRFLYWSGGAWHWDYSWLGHGWFDRSPAAVLASVTQP